MVSQKEVCRKTTKMLKNLPIPPFDCICAHGPGDSASKPKLRCKKCYNTRTPILAQHLHRVKQQEKPSIQNWRPKHRPPAPLILTLDRVKLVLPPISLEMQKSRHIKETSQSCVFVSSQVASPIPRWDHKLLLQNVLFFPSVTAAAREALMSIWLSKAWWHSKSPKHHFCTSNHCSIASRVSW